MCRVNKHRQKNCAKEQQLNSATKIRLSTNLLNSWYTILNQFSIGKNPSEVICNGR